MMMIYQTKFYTDIFGLEGAIAGTVMLVARITDAFVDPTVGLLSDRTKTRFGKYRPWVLWTALPFMVFYVLAFYNPGIEDKGLVALYATLSYTLLMSLYSFNNTPYASLGGVMSGDIKERTSITSIRFVAAIDSVVGLIPFGTIIFWVITSFRGVTSSPMKRMAPTRELVDEFSETLIVNLVISPCVSCESTTAQWLSLPSV